MQMFENLPWYSYVILALALVSYAYKYFSKAKEGYDEAMPNAKFKSNPESTLSKQQLFSIALYTPIAEWWGAHTNTLTFLNAKKIKPYLEGWYINTPEGYWDLTNYFMKEGRRWYFDGITEIQNTQPETDWNHLMQQKFGNNDRAQRYFEVLKNKTVLNELKQLGIFTFDSEIEIGVVGYDAAMLVGQARKAFTAGIISEEEAWKVINFARDLAVQQFNSWDDFGKSFILGFALDMKADYKEYRKEVFHIYQQVTEHPNSPWNTIQWPN